MFGLLRFILASIVVLNHIARFPDYAAHYSVWGFFAISGFLMTLILKKKYSVQENGLGKFTLNRFLRIYPTYWFSILLSVLLIFIFSESLVTQFHPAIRIPKTAYEVLSNVGIFGLIPDNSYSRLTPPAWALYIELVYYLAIGLLFFRSSVLNLIWALLTFIYCIYFVVIKEVNVYNDIIACGLPFSLGGLGYYLYEKIKEQKYIMTYVLSVLVFFIHLMIIAFTKSNPYGVNLLIVPFYFLIIVVFLARVKTENKLFKMIDKISGDLSYPIYLLHWQVGYLVWEYTKFTKLALFMLVYPLVILLAYLVNKLIEHPIQNIRLKIIAPPKK